MDATYLAGHTPCAAHAQVMAKVCSTLRGRPQAMEALRQGLIVEDSFGVGYVTKQALHVGGAGDAGGWGAEFVRCWVHGVLSAGTQGDPDE